MTASARLAGCAYLLAECAAIVRALVLKLGRGEHVFGVDHKQKIVVRLQVNIPGVRLCRYIVNRGRFRRIPYVNDAESLREHVAHVCIATMDHELYTVGAATLV